MSRISTIIALPLLIAACGEAEANQEEQFRESFAQSCVQSATQAGVNEGDAQTVCDCSADKVVEEMGIVLNVPTPVADRIITECMAEAGLAQG